MFRLSIQAVLLLMQLMPSSTRSDAAEMQMPKTGSLLHAAAVWACSSLDQVPVWRVSAVSSSCRGEDAASLCTACCLEVVTLEAVAVNGNCQSRKPHDGKNKLT